MSEYAEQPAFVLRVNLLRVEIVDLHSREFFGVVLRDHTKTSTISRFIQTGLITNWECPRSKNRSQPGARSNSTSRHKDRQSARQIFRSRFGFPTEFRRLCQVVGMEQRALPTSTTSFPDFPARPK